MKVIWHIFITDLRKLFSNVISAVVVMGLMLVPPLYAWFTTLGFWDPYGNTGHLMVAVANNDEGYKSDLLPVKINAGNEIVSALRANDQFGWQFVSEEEAVDGVKSGAYYAALVIPKEFSDDLMTVFSDKVQHADIVYYSNEKENAIAPRVTSTGASTLQETIDETFTETVAGIALDTTSNMTDYLDGDGILSYGRTLVSRMGNAVDVLNTSADQAKSFAALLKTTDSLVGATSQALSGVGKTPDATVPLITSAVKGLKDAQSAINQTGSLTSNTIATSSKSFDAMNAAINSAFDTMQNDPAAAQKVITSLNSDVGNYLATYQQVRAQVASLDANSPVLGALDKVITELTALQKSLSQASSAIDAGTQAVEQQRAQADQAVADAKKAVQALQGTSSSKTLSQDLQKLITNLEQVGTTSSELTTQIKDTATSLGDTASSLSTSIKSVERSLAHTARILHDAADKMEKSRDELSKALESGDLGEIKRIIGNDPQAVAQFLAAPTKLETHAVYEVPNNGSGMSPFYTSLCLWIGAIFLVALASVQLSEERVQELTQRFGRPPTPSQRYWGRYTTFMFIALMQGMLVCLGNVFFLGVQCEHFWLYLLAGGLAAIVFSNLVYTLTISFGNVGKAIAIIGLVVQLAGSSGIFPVQMSAEFFQVLYPYLPFTHSMEAFQGCIAGIYGDRYWVAMGTLALFLIPSLVLGLVLRRPIIRLNDYISRKLDETELV